MQYTELTKTYEFLVKFQVTVEPSDNSSVASVLNLSQNPEAAQKVKAPSEIVEQKQRKRNLRKEARIFEESRPFGKTFDEKVLLKYLIELVAKAGNLLSCVGS